MYKMLKLTNTTLMLVNMFVDYLKLFNNNKILKSLRKDNKGT